MCIYISILRMHFVASMSYLNTFIKGKFLSKLCYVSFIAVLGSFWKNFAIEKCSPLLFCIGSESSTRGWTFSTTREAEQISSVANECKNMISLSVFFAGDGQIMECETGFTCNLQREFATRGMRFSISRVFQCKNCQKLFLRHLQHCYDTLTTTGNERKQAL